MCEAISRRDRYIHYVVNAQRCFLKFYTSVSNKGRQRTGTTRQVTTDELTFELISNLFFHLSAVIWCLTNSIFLPKVYAIFNNVFSVWRDHYFATLLNFSHKDIFLQLVTLGTRDFSSAVSSFCQVFIVTRPKRTADVFLVVAKTRTKSIQKQIKSIDVDKVGSKIL